MSQFTRFGSIARFLVGVGLGVIVPDVAVAEFDTEPELAELGLDCDDDVLVVAIVALVIVDAVVIVAVDNDGGVKGDPAVEFPETEETVMGLIPAGPVVTEVAEPREVED